MNKVVIFTDSCVDLGKDITDKLGIEVVPLLITIGEKVYKDGVDIFQKDIVKSVLVDNVFPKTSAVAPGVFAKRFEPYIKKGYDIIYCGIGSNFSATYNSVLIAMNDFPKGRIFLIDSKNLSSGIGLLVLKCVKFKNEGMSAEEIAHKVAPMADKLCVQFVVDTLDSIYKGGRCSGTVYFFAKHLKVHPILRVADDKLTVYKKPRGALSKAWNEMISDFKKDIPEVDMDNVIITGCQNEDGEKYVYEELKKIVPDANILKTQVGSIIATHCGPNTTGILYLKK
ncbi:MAG: DegV family protein [Erysipelotrichaceae bacterium]|nr:DegV family protein [Erysipelotrichaceae bacterium]